MADQLVALRSTVDGLLSEPLEKTEDWRAGVNSGPGPLTCPLEGSFGRSKGRGALTGVTVTGGTRAEPTVTKTSERFSSSTRERLAIETADGEQVLRGARPSFKGDRTGADPHRGISCGGLLRRWDRSSTGSPSGTSYRQRMPVLHMALRNAGKRIGQRSRLRSLVSGIILTSRVAGWPLTSTGIGRPSCRSPIGAQAGNAIAAEPPLNQLARNHRPPGFNCRCC
jgi:hypothetical protein